MTRQRVTAARATGNSAPREQAYELRITLMDVRPSIWRQVRVPAAWTLDHLDRGFQKVMGWKSYHLHEWVVAGRRYGVPDPDWEDREVLQEQTVRLRDIAPVEEMRFTYVYDFGDNWEHEVVVERILSSTRDVPYAVCLAGERCCPTEDCGGPGGYEELLEALRDPRHPEHDAMVQWAGPRFDPEAFDLAKVNRALKRLS